MRFLHLADIHLDSPFAGRSDRVRKRLREATREAFGRALRVALDRRADVVLIAGDLFEGDAVSFATEHYLMRELRRLDEAGIPVVYATGNHDPAEADRRVHTLSWPANVRVVAETDPVRIEVERDGRKVGSVTTAGHGSHRESDDLSARFPPPDNDGLPQVAMLHTQVRQAAVQQEGARYAPSELSRLKESGYHYWALGHVHTRAELSELPPIHYPGNLQGRNPTETGAKGALFVDLADPRYPEVQFHPLAPVEWIRLPIDDLAQLPNAESLVERIVAVWEERDPARTPQSRASRELMLELPLEPVRDPPEPDDWALVVDLVGPTPLWKELADEEERRELAEEVARRLEVLLVEVRADATHPVLDVEAQRERRDPLGTALRRIAAVRAGEAEVEGLDPSELAGWSPDDPKPLAEYLADVLEGGEAEVLVRMHPDAGTDS